MEVCEIEDEDCMNPSEAMKELMEELKTYFFGEVGEWSDWSACSKTCGGGSRTRTRECQSTNFEWQVCKEDLVEEETCGTGSCSTDSGNCLDSLLRNTVTIV